MTFPRTRRNEREFLIGFPFFFFSFFDSGVGTKFLRVKLAIPCSAVEATRAPKTNPLDMPGKYVRRFNLRFLDEDAEEFEHRLLEAAVRREQAEEYLRTQMYLDENIPDSEIPPMNQEQVHRIIDLCHSDFPPELMPMVESFFQDMKDNYIRAIKLATLNYERCVIFLGHCLHFGSSLPPSHFLYKWGFSFGLLWCKYFFLFLLFCILVLLSL